MGNQNIISQNLLETDRIVEINGFNLFVHDNYRPTRRNIVCYSHNLNTYIRNNNLSPNNHAHIILISELLYDMQNNMQNDMRNNMQNGMKNDIRLISVKGYY